MINKLYEMNLSVIAVKRNSKQPEELNWQQYCQVLPTVEKAESLQRLWESNLINIGLACGPASNIIALDIDTDDQDILDICPPSPVRRRGKKGEVRFFQFNESIPSVKTPLVEILTTGRQVILPPSIHPETGKPYVWMTEDTLENMHSNDLPQLDMTFWTQVSNLGGQTFQYKEGRNNYLKKIVGAMRGRGQSEAEIIDEVWKQDLLYSGVNRLFMDPKEYSKTDNEDDAKQNAAIFVTSNTLSMLKNGSIKISSVLEQFKIDIDETPKEVKKLPEMTGLNKRIYDYILRHTPERCEEFAMGATVTLMSTLCANRFKCHGVWSNMYTLLVGPTGIGKSTSLSPISTFLLNTSEESINLMGHGGYTSAKAMLKGLVKNRERLDLMDEFGSFMLETSQGNSSSKELMQSMSNLWSASKDVYQARTYVDSKEDTTDLIIHNPCVSLLAAVQGSLFTQHAHANSVLGGFFPRFVFFVAKETETQKFEHINVRSGEFLLLADEIKKVLKLGKNVYKVNGKESYNPKDIWPKTSLFEELALDIRRKSKDMAKEHSGTPLADFYSRRFENICKLATVDAVSQTYNTDAVFLTEANVTWATEVYDIGLQAMAPDINLIGAGEFAKEVSKILAIIARAPNGVSRREISRKTKQPSKALNDPLDYLIEQGTITKYAHDNSLHYKLS